MTIKEFSRKYNVTYHLAYLASYGVQSESTWVRDRDFPEDKLYKNLVSLLNTRWEKQLKQIRETESTLSHVKYRRMHG